MSPTDELICRLEAATGPDRELDHKIWFVLDQPLPDDHVDCPPRYTGSIDAALALVQDRCRWLLDKRPYGDRRSDGFRAQVYPQGSPDKPSEHWGPTPAVALCIAALRARAANGGTEP